MQPRSDSGKPALAPLQTTVAGRDLVVIPFAVQIPGRGTTPPHISVDVVSVDASTGRQVSSALVDLDSEVTDLRYFDVVPVGISGQTVILRVTSMYYTTVIQTYAVDLLSGRTLWRNGNFAVQAVVGSTAVGTTTPNGSGPYSVAGVNVMDGKTVWTGSDSALLDASIFPAGPSNVVTFTSEGPGGYTMQVIQADTGAVKADQKGDFNRAGCYYDGRATVVCAGYRWTAAFDATTLEPLWSLPDTGTNRIAPTVTAVWHGIVYGTTDNGPVALDARTGQDKPNSPGASPYIVDSYVGVGVDTANHLAVVYPADG